MRLHSSAGQLHRMQKFFDKYPCPCYRSAPWLTKLVSAGLGVFAVDDLRPAWLAADARCQVGCSVHSGCAMVIIGDPMPCWTAHCSENPLAELQMYAACISRNVLHLLVLVVVVVAPESVILRAFVSIPLAKARWRRTPVRRATSLLSLLYLPTSLPRRCRRRPQRLAHMS